MNSELNDTHDASRRSWVESSNAPDTDFPIQNLPFGVFEAAGRSARGGVAIGDQIFDLTEALSAGLFQGAAETAAGAASGPDLAPFLASGNRSASILRARISDLLRADGPERGRFEAMAERLLVPMNQAKLLLPARIGSFTDFLCSEHHTRRMSATNSLPPAFCHLPIGYNSRASSVRVSGEAVRRPNGQFKTSDGNVEFGPEPKQDFELEVGAFIGVGNELGMPIPIDTVQDHIFGYCLLNDWSARGIQAWESQPLGPFLSKSLSTTISPWIVTQDALAPFRTAAHIRQADEPASLPYLTSTVDSQMGGIDIALEAYLQTSRMRGAHMAPFRITNANFKHMYWTFGQMVTHHAGNGCNLRPGDLLGSGTTSGPAEELRSCIAELTRRGADPIALPNGESRAWVEDGDEIILRGRASRPGFVSIGFGECRGEILPAMAWPTSPTVRGKA